MSYRRNWYIYIKTFMSFYMYFRDRRWLSFYIVPFIEKFINKFYYQNIRFSVFDWIQPLSIQNVICLCNLGKYFNKNAFVIRKFLLFSFDPFICINLFLSIVLLMSISCTAVDQYNTIQYNTIEYCSIYQFRRWDDNVNLHI